MVDGRRRDAWWHTARLMAHIQNQNPYSTKTAKPEQFHPYRPTDEASQEGERATISMDQFIAIQKSLHGMK